MKQPAALIHLDRVAKIAQAVPLAVASKDASLSQSARGALLSAACRPPAGVSSASRHLESGRAGERQLRTPNPVTPCSRSLFSLLCVSLPCARLHLWCAHILIPPAADNAGAFAEMNAVVFADTADPFAADVVTSLVNRETGWVGSDGWSASLKGQDPIPVTSADVIACWSRTKMASSP